jgi:NitT/TauT family transport system substrate-binding protein
MQRRSFLVLAIGAAVGCHRPNDPPESEPSPALHKVRVGYIPIVNCSQIFVAAENGYFRRHGLDVELVSMIGGEKIMTAVTRGEVEVGFSNVASTVFTVDDGYPLVSVVGGAMQDETCPVHAIFVRADSPILTVADLAGKRVAVNTNRAIDEGMVPPLVRKHRADPSGMTFVPIPFARMHAAVQAGEVDAVVSIEPYVTMGNRDRGLRRLSYNYVELQPVTEISSLVTTRPWAVQNPAAVAGFRTAIIEASRFANENPAAVRAVLRKYVPLDDGLAAEVVLPKFLDRSLDEGRLDEMIDRMRAANWLKRPFRATDILLPK